MTWVPKKIVLLANTKKAPHPGYKRYMLPFDFTMLATHTLLEQAIKNCGYELIHYSDIRKFIKNIQEHESDLVFPYYFGVGWKMRQTSVQSICENYGIKYVGSDSYARAITTDKVLAKELCRHVGINTPLCKTLFSEELLPDISSLKFPVIVKPRFEGDSIGITEKGIFNTEDGVLDYSLKLFRELKSPIIIEEFKEGREMSVAVIGYQNKIIKTAFFEQKKNGNLISYADKRTNIKINKYNKADSYFNEEIREKILHLFSSLDKLEFCRIDFILHQGVLYNLEITVDPTLSRFSGMYWGFNKEMSFSEFINLIITNCLNRYRAIGEI